MKGPDMIHSPPRLQKFFIFSITKLGIIAHVILIVIL